MSGYHPSHRPGSAPAFASFPAPDRTIDIGFVHVGKHEWKNGAEMEWKCADNCPHPDHDHEDAS